MNKAQRKVKLAKRRFHSIKLGSKQYAKTFITGKARLTTEGIAYLNNGKWNLGRKFTSGDIVMVTNLRPMGEWTGQTTVYHKNLSGHSACAGEDGIILPREFRGRLIFLTSEQFVKL
jgi:hypothetical protein